ncbi:MAG: LacI family DNA-binding transcriptional regulator [Armatimonadota bacterium]
MTIEEFARSVGVSTATVSRTLSGRGPVSEEKRRLILDRMGELGYVPNLAARTLVTGRTNTVLLACGEVPALGDLYTLEMIRGVQNALAAHHYGLLLNAPDRADTGVMAVVTGRAVDGVLLMDEDDTGPDPLLLAQKITERGIPCVIIGHRPIEDRPGIGSVVIDVEASGEAAAHLLLERGHRRIGFIGSRSPDKLLSRFRATLEQAGCSLPASQVVIAGKEAEQGRLSLHTLLDRQHGTGPLTAVFARTDSLAAGALQAARQRGLRVPEDLSIIGHDDVPFSALTAPPLTTLRVDCGKVGAAAAEMLLHLFRKEAAPGVRIFYPELVLRETVAEPRQNEL